MVIPIKTTLACFAFAAVIVNSAFAQQHNCPVTQANRADANFVTLTPQKLYTDNDKLLSVTPTTYHGNPDFGKLFIGKRFEDSTNWYEQLDKRTLKTRSYINVNDPAKVLVESGYDNLNYVDEHRWIRAVDTKLKAVTNCWCATQQETPVYIYKDASTALSIGANSVMIFNKNVQFNTSPISVTDYTVGDNGMYIKNAATNTDKIIRAGRGLIETDYKIVAPLKLSGDLVISEDISLPQGYTITNTVRALDVNDANGKTVAEFELPFCYDHNHSAITGSYKIESQAEGYRLEVVVPSAWLNASSRIYPIIIDPIVVGTLATWSGGKIGSCFNKSGKDNITGEDTGILRVTIPAAITVTNFLVQIGTYAPLVPPDSTKMFFTTNCFDTVFASDTATKKTNSYEHLNADFIQQINTSYLGCYAPSCDTTSFGLKVTLVRMTGGSGCDDTTYFYYDPANNFGYPFEAYVEGYKDENYLSSPGWTVSPTQICGSVCTIRLLTTSIYGVPPYTITHPWASGSTNYGTYNAATASSRGLVNIQLNIPNCPGAACTASSITVPPPTVVDACGDTISGFASITVPVIASPDVVFSPDPDSICSGNSVNLLLSSCITGSTYKWTRTGGASGSGSAIADTVVNNDTIPKTVTFMVTATSPGGCASVPVAVPVVVSLLGTLNILPQEPVICSGKGVILYVSGNGGPYTWSPAAGLSVTTGDSVLANPTVQTTYTVTSKDSIGCISAGTDVIGVIPAPNKPSITISVTGDSLISSAGSYNQWYFDGVPLQDSTGEILIIKGHARGWYEVTVTNPANGCSTTSDSTTSIDQLTINSAQVAIYPNPFNSEVSVKISSGVNNVKSWNLQLTDVLGRTLLYKSSLSHTNTIDLSGLPCGVYFITILNNTNRAVFPVVKQE